MEDRFNYMEPPEPDIYFLPPLHRESPDESNQGITTPLR
jgi:hypothetical protein